MIDEMKAGRRRERTVAGLCLLLGLLEWAGSARPAEDPIAAIRALYTRTNESVRIAREKRGEGGGLYATEVSVNSLDGPWRAVGNYARKATFWFSDQPEFARMENREELSVLVKVEVQTTAAVRTTQEEFLFDGGTLVFYYRRAKAGQEAAEEDRLYFQGGRLIRRIPDPPAGEDPADAAAVQGSARALQNLFLATFE
ncbi:MAG: hypothetical protein MUQ00_05280 [Candidatus Aminicenantes bacterium]|jgi:hypothetical protein|nr:hypothetical protein [Candidatus Aminicenantes bacterium]